MDITDVLDESITAGTKKHEHKFKEDAYLNWTFEEFGKWIDLLIKRVDMRTTIAGRNKDLEDIQNYLELMNKKAETYLDLTKDPMTAKIDDFWYDTL